MKTVILFVLAFTSLSVAACPLCEKQQPSLLKGISHGTGPQDNWDYLIVIMMVIIVLLTLFYALKFILKPREMDKSHIKRVILN